MWRGMAAKARNKWICVADKKPQQQQQQQLKLTISSMRKIKFHSISRSADKNQSIWHMRKKSVCISAVSRSEWESYGRKRAFLCVWNESGFWFWTIFSKIVDLYAGHSHSFSQWFRSVNTPIGLLTDRYTIFFSLSFLAGRRCCVWLLLF